MRRLVIVGILLILAACTGAVVENEEDTTTTTSEIPDPPAPDPSPAEETTTTAEPEKGTRTNPIPVGAAGIVGDYEITVVGYEPDATADVLAYNEFNEDPADGSVFSLIRLSYTYVGDETGTVWIDLSWSGIGESNVASEPGECTTYEDNAFDVAEIFPNGTTESNVCLTVIASDLESLILVMESFFSFDDERVFFALP